MGYTIAIRFCDGQLASGSNVCCLYEPVDAFNDPAADAQVNPAQDASSVITQGSSKLDPRSNPTASRVTLPRRLDSASDQAGKPRFLRTNIEASSR